MMTERVGLVLHLLPNEHDLKMSGCLARRVGRAR